jgi:cellobiose phosphorylase
MCNSLKQNRSGGKSYGHFDDETKEYVISCPDTPTPWINYLGEKDYLAMISNTGGGYSFYRDPRQRRVIRYRYNAVPADNGGRALYLRLSDGDFWSPTWQPVRKELQAYECYHGAGYTRIRSVYRGVEAEVTYFVPLSQTLEVWRVTLHNTNDKPLELQVFSLVEFCLWNALDDMTNFQRNYNTGELEVEDGVIYHKTEYRERRNHFAYFACSEPVAGFDTSRDAFLGPYRGFDCPLVVQEGKSNNFVAHGWAPIGSHQIRLTLAPNESHEIIFLLGYAENQQDKKFSAPGVINKSNVKRTIRQYLDPAKVDAAFEALRKYWDELFSIYSAQTPDKHVNRMVNVWNPYQCTVTFNLSRSASFYESGISRGIGFRDTNQDLLGYIHMLPARARERILDLAATQLPNGGAYHQYDPLTKRGNADVGGGFNDDPQWLVLSVAAYLKETGDFSILDESVVYDNKPSTEQPIYEHLKRALQYTLDRLGPHRLPLIGHADWNDCLNLNCFSATPGESFQTHMDTTAGTTAESVFIAGLFTLAAKEMSAIAKCGGHQDDVAYYLNQADQMAQRVMEHGWDGEWFLRAYDHFGAKIGSKECDEGRIFIEPQGICIMAGIGVDNGRAVQALDSVQKHLATEHGIVLNQPAYTHYYLNLGEISSYPPGYKENASVFCHTNPWIMISEAILGRGDRAFDYYMRICPSAREPISNIHRCEPYIYAQTIAGRDAPTFGEAKNSWLTGTAAWNLVAITQWILGVRADHDGLIVDPCIPKEWSGFKVTRRFRGATYVIEVKNPSHVCKGVKKVTVDGKILDNKLLPIFGDNKMHQVNVLLGTKAQ